MHQRIIHDYGLQLNKRIEQEQKSCCPMQCSMMTLHCPGQLSLLPSVGREMSTGQIDVMLCGWGVKERRFIPFVDKRVGGR